MVEALALQPNAPMRATGRRLVSCRTGELAGRAYLTTDGRRHWLTTAAHVSHYGFAWPGDLEQVDEAEIRALTQAPPAPLPWSEAHWAAPPRTSIGDMREIATSRLRGTGIEFGAGTMPLAVPLGCTVRYADAFSMEGLVDRSYRTQGRDFVPLDFVTSLEEMQGIDDRSVDFILAAHVIEHTRNPLLALRSAFEKLRLGGMFVLIVPEKRLCFDRDRRTTPLDHVIADYEQPSAARDVLHYVEFYSKAFVTPLDTLYDRVENAVATNGDIHFHAWTYESFCELVKYVRDKIAPWSEVWSQPALDHLAEANEFYFVLTK